MPVAPAAPDTAADGSIRVDLREVIQALSDALDLVGIDDVAHGKRVGIMAAQCARQMGLPARETAFLFDLGLLHDIGTYFLLKQDGSDGEPLKFSKKRYILHGLKGYEHLLDEGVDESIAQFCRNHTGVGLTREDVVRQELPLPPADYVPMNLEQEVVMYADKFHSKSVPPKFLQVEAYTARAERFGGENKQRWLDLVAKYGVPDIPALAEKYGMRMI